MTVLSLTKSHFIFHAHIVLKSLMLLFVHLILLFVHLILLFVHLILLFVHLILLFVNLILLFVHLILLFVHLISLCCPVLFQAHPIDFLNHTSYMYSIYQIQSRCIYMCTSISTLIGIIFNPIHLSKYHLAMMRCAAHVVLACGCMFHAYHFHCQTKTHQSLIFSAVSGSFSASTPDVSSV